MQSDCDSRQNLDTRCSADARRSPLGDCATMLLLVHACFTVASWVTGGWESPYVWTMICASCWLILKGTGGVRSPKISLPITITILAGMWLTFPRDVGTIADWLFHGPFSPLVLAALLCSIVIIDLWALCKRQGVQILSLLSRHWGWGLAILFVTYMIVVPGVDAILEHFEEPVSSRVLEDMSFAEAVRLRTTETFFTVWFFALGATVGSYLNVIVYRIPRGESLVTKRSACPQCSSPIAGRDNVPVLGWIWLKGKCRSCQLPISIRYPTVEAVTGSLFLLLYFAELLSGGQNLPVRIPNHHAGVVWILFYTKWDLVGLFSYHCLLLVALLTWSLIRYDRNQVRWQSVLTTGGLAVIPLLIWPHLHLVHWGDPSIPYSQRTVTDALIGAGLGGIVGGILGVIVIWFSQRAGETVSAGRAYGEGLALTGIMLGWQAACSVLALSMLLRLVQLSLARNWGWSFLYKWPWTGALFLAVVTQLLCWRLLVATLIDWWPTRGIGIVPMIVWLGTIVSASVALWLRPSIARVESHALASRRQQVHA